MENTHNWDQIFLINELKKGRELVQQLRIHLDTWSFSSTGESLITKLLCSFDKSLVMLNLVKFETEPQLSGTTAVTATEPPCSVSESDYDDSVLRYKSKKRRIVPRWTEEVRVCPKTGLEGPIDDAYSWRKYGQKDIHGAKYPRGYYRCTYRDAQDCLAIKQVQRLDEDSTMFRVTYQGRHTCFQASHVIPLPVQSPNTQNQDKQQKKSQEIIINFQTGSEAKREDLQANVFTSLTSFPSTSSVPISCFEKENHVFVSSLTPDNHFMGSFSPPSISPTTSESNYLSPHGMNSFGAQVLQTSDSELSEIVSAATSSFKSPILDMDFDFAVDFDSQFQFDIPDLFS